MGEWSSWYWVGACLLGLALLELAQRHFFPGEKPFLWGWLGRTRRRETPGGDDPGHWIVPRGNASIRKLLPQLPELSKQLVHDDPVWVARRIRKILFETSSQPSKVVLNCLLAEVALRQRDREEAHHQIEEAIEILNDRCDPLDSRTRMVAERLDRFRVFHALREGRSWEVFEILTRAERRFGTQDWIALSRAQAYLLVGKEDLCRREGRPYMIEEGKRRHKRFPPNATAARLLVAESYLQEGEMDQLQDTLRKFKAKSRLPEQDQAVLARLQLEVLLHLNNRPAAWRQVGILSRLCERNPHDRGSSRTLHLACSRIHVVEGNYVEAHRRLQLAENEAEYPVAVWDVRLHLGMTLEAEGRTDEARSIWENLAQEAAKTRFGALAESRRIRLTEPEKPVIPLGIPPLVGVSK